MRLTLLTIIASIIGATTSSLSASAVTVNLSFDDIADGEVTPPFVGSGTFSFDGNPGDGTFALTSLPNYSFSISFGSDTFGNSNIVTPLSEVLVLLSNSGQQVNFSNINPSGSGPFGGSIDFQNPTNTDNTVLSFEPPEFGGNLDLYYNDTSFGNYTAPVPVPFEFSPASGLLLSAALFAGLKTCRQFRSQ